MAAATKKPQSGRQMGCSTGGEGMTCYQAAGLEVEVDQSTQWATVYRQDGSVAGTLQRRRATGKTGKAWRVYTPDGTMVYETDYGLFRMMLRALV